MKKLDMLFHDRNVLELQIAYCAKRKEIHTSDFVYTRTANTVYGVHTGHYTPITQRTQRSVLLSPHEMHLARILGISSISHYMYKLFGWLSLHETRFMQNVFFSFASKIVKVNTC